MKFFVRISLLASLAALVLSPADAATKASRRHATRSTATAHKSSRHVSARHKTVRRSGRARHRAVKPVAEPKFDAYELQNWPSQTDVLAPVVAVSTITLPPPPPASFINCRACTSPLIARAYSLIGTRYRSGGTSPETGFDCSGFTRYIYETAAGYTLPPSAPLQYNFAQGLPIGKDELQPGDLVFFRTRRGWHVGMYVGENSFIHAPNRRRTVSVSSLGDGYWRAAYRGARRIPLPESVLASGDVASNN